MIERDLLTLEAIVLLEDSLSVSNHRGGLSWLRVMFLFTTLASSAKRRWLDLAGGGVQLASSLTVGEDCCVHEELNLSKPNVSKVEVPMEQFFLGFTEFRVSLEHSRQGTGKFIQNC